MKKIYIGIGHGGTDPGAVAPDKQEEADINLKMGLAALEYLQGYDCEVMLSRNNDVNQGVTDKTVQANNFKPDVAVEIHNNAGGGDGFEAYHQTNAYSEQSVKLGKAIEAQIVGIRQNSRGLKTRINSYGTDYYGFLRLVKAPSILLECAFLDNDYDYSQIDELHEQKAFGIAIAKGIVEYLQLSPKQELKPTPPFTSNNEALLTRIEELEHEKQACLDKIHEYETALNSINDILAVYLAKGVD